MHISVRIEVGPGLTGRRSLCRTLTVLLANAKGKFHMVPLRFTVSVVQDLPNGVRKVKEGFPTGGDRREEKR